MLVESLAVLDEEELVDVRDDDRLDDEFRPPDEDDEVRLPVDDPLPFIDEPPLPLVDPPLPFEDVLDDAADASMSGNTESGGRASRCLST